MCRTFLAVLAVFLVICGTGIIDVGALLPHEDDCADRCCQEGTHCTCCCVSHSMTLAPESGALRQPEACAPFAGTRPAFVPSDLAFAIFHPPRA